VAGAPGVLKGWHMKSQTNLEDKNFKVFFDRIGYTFKDFGLLLRAFTHRSYVNEHTEALEDNERLEFLGDAVLDYLVGVWLYHRFPEMNEGELTKLRSALVRTEQLAQFSEQLGLDDMMLLGRGEEEAGGRKRPALLCATFEALVGAMCLDGDIQSVKSFIDPLLYQTAGQILDERKDQDPKSFLQEWAQSQGYGTPIYRLVLAYGPEHEKIFTIEVIINNTVYGIGEGRSKQLAAKSAAINALLALDLK
jgi:ribonuclease-3